MQFLIDAATWFKAVTTHLFLAASALLLLEILFPKSRYPIAARARAIIFWLSYISVTAIAVTFFYTIWASLGINPLLTVDLSFLSSSQYSPIKFLGGIVASIIAFQGFTFFYYWFHRIQHSNKLLWEFHAVHHSIEEMSAFNSYHHFTEEIFRIPLLVVPMSLLIKFEQGYVPWIWAVLFSCQSIFEHSSTKLHFGWLRYIIPDNRFHRIHHSRDPKHWNKNFGSGSAIWDVLFGTVYHPKNEWPDVGLDDIREPKTLREYLFRPFTRVDDAGTSNSEATQLPEARR